MNTQASIIAESQKLVTDNLIILYELDLTHVQFGVIRFTPNTTESRQLVMFGGHAYTPWDVEVEGFEASTTGSAARPTLKASATFPELIQLVRDAKLQGSEFRRIRTFRKFLDDGSMPDSTCYLPLDIYRVERIAEFIPGRSVTLELASPLDMEHVYFPKRQILKENCYWRYRVWDASRNAFSYSDKSPCPYAGTRYFDQLNKPTDKAGDRCAYTLEACKLRFGERAHLPFGGFPGAAQPSR